MSRTVTSLYDTAAEAEAARQRLASEVNLSSARVVDQKSESSGGPDGSLNRVAMSHEDRHAYGEAIRRGGFMLVAEVSGHEDADKIVRLLEEGSSVDLDQRQEQWRKDGWSPQPARSASATGTAATGSVPRAGAAQMGAGNTVGEERIPIVEEEMVVGKREVERGGARVRSYVREVPVHEQVTLREEHVSVERRPLDQRLSETDLDQSDLLRERNIEVTAMAEEPVVSKEARMREEIVVRKTAEQHVQPVTGTVARTEVDVDGDRSALAGTNTGAGLSGNHSERSSFMAQDNSTTGSTGAGFGTTGSTGTTGTTGSTGSTGSFGSTTGSTGSTGSFGSTTGSTGSTGAFGSTSTGTTLGAGSQMADTMRPTGGTTQPSGYGETRGFEEARTSYQPSQTDVSVTQRRSASRPSRSVIIGSAIAGAVAGGAIPFMLSGRKSGQTRSATVHHSGKSYQGQTSGTYQGQTTGASSQGQTSGVHQDQGASAVHTDTGPVTDASTRGTGGSRY